MKARVRGHKRMRLQALRHFERPWPWLVVCECGWLPSVEDGPPRDRYEAVLAHRVHKSRMV